jgi:predicted O-methyltransferase YrrM
MVSKAVRFGNVEDSCLHRILNGYADRGYPLELINSWALPSRDAHTLVQLIEQQQPSNVLEIGTFVGVSTLMMATKLQEGAVIHTIDPNFPLSVELGAMNTKAGEADLTMRQQELASAVAQQLGLSHKITFHAGGFSTSATFTSTKQDTSKTVPVIGPKVCKEHGPFDFIFIDGLHYTDAVLSDLRLASSYLRPGGRIVLHDVIGMWGSNVRRAIFHFLSETSAFTFQHGRYADIFDSIGILQHGTQPRLDFSSGGEPPVATSLLDRPEFVSNLASLASNMCAPRSVAYMGHDRGGLLEQLAQSGVTDLCHVGAPAEMGAGLMSSRHTVRREPFDFQKVYEPVTRFDLCVFLDQGGDWDDGRLQCLIDSCVACSDTIFFGSTPPGERGIAASGARPLAWWVREFWKRGYVFHDAIRPWLEPLRFSYSFSPTYEVTSSELANLYLIRREPLNDASSDRWEHWLVEKESRVEDLAVQAVFSDILIQHLLKQSKEGQDLVAEQNMRLQFLSREHEQAIAERDAHIRQIESHVAEYERVIEERDMHVRQIESRVMEYERKIEERDMNLRQMKQALDERNASLQRIEQSLEYWAGRRLGTYPVLLRTLARLHRMFRLH